MTDDICPHCKMDTNIRNPSGYCDHLHYPEDCAVCKLISEGKCWDCRHKRACNRTEEGCNYFKKLGLKNK